MDSLLDNLLWQADRAKHSCWSGCAGPFGKSGEFVLCTGAKSKGYTGCFALQTIVFLTLTSKGVNIMLHRRTGENKRQEHKNYLARYRKLVKMQKTHYSKYLEVKKELDELSPHLEKSRHGNG